MRHSVCAMIMMNSELVHRAMSEGGSAMEVLRSMLDRGDYDTDMKVEEVLRATIGELCKLKVEVSTLETRVNQMNDERDKMVMLIWTEISRLATKLDLNSGGGMSDSPT